MENYVANIDNFLLRNLSYKNWNVKTLPKLIINHNSTHLETIHFSFIKWLILINCDNSFFFFSWLEIRFHFTLVEFVRSVVIFYLKIWINKLHLNYIMSSCNKVINIVKLRLLLSMVFGYGQAIIEEGKKPIRVLNFQSKREGLYCWKSGKVSGMYCGKFIKVYDPLRVVRKLEESQETTNAHGTVSW